MSMTTDLRAACAALFSIREDLSPRLSVLLGGAFLAVLLLVWWGVTGLGLVSDMFLPSPAAVARAGWRMYLHEGLLLDVAVSVYRVLVGFGLAAVLAVPLGLLMGSFAAVRAVFEPFLAFVRYMPVTAFIPLLVIWFGIDDAQKFSVIFIGSFFTLALMVMVSAQAVPIGLIEAAIMLGATRRQLVTRVIWPAARPAIFDNLRICLGWAWTYIVIAEIVAAASGIGYVILRASRFMATDEIFVGILSIGLVGLLTDALFAAASRRLFPYLQRSRS